MFVQYSGGGSILSQAYFQGAETNLGLILRDAVNPSMAEIAPGDSRHFPPPCGSCSRLLLPGSRRSYNQAQIGSS